MSALPEPLQLLPIFLFALPFALLFLEGKKPKDFLKHLSLQPIPATRLFADGLKLFAKSFVALYALIAILAWLGLADTIKVADIVRQQDALTLLVAVSFGPLAEELFFRGYLQKRIGVILASLVFAFLHKGYGSIAEVLGAFIVSVIFGHYARENKSVLPPFLAHALYNAMSVLVAMRI